MANPVSGGEVTIETGRIERPMVTREQYDQARAVLDALPSGIYIKCYKCKGWKRGGAFKTALEGVYCEKCF